MTIYESAVFSVSASSLGNLPAAALPEIAFAGRSNVGKSTTINVLTRKSRLAYASKTPGRTQLINFFELSERGERRGAWIPRGYLVDLPGYGFAKASTQVRASWSDLVGGYVASRSSLAGLVLVMDSRRPLADSDLWVVDFMADKRPAIPMVWLLNKSDQLRTVSEKRDLILRMRERAKAAPNPVSVLYFSGLKKTGAEDLGSVLDTWLGLADRACVPR